MLLQLLSRRLTGLSPVRAPLAAGTSSLQLPTCLRCRVHNALIHTSQPTLWRTRQERKEALHGNEDRPRQSRVRRSDSEDHGRRHHARPSHSKRSNDYQPREYARRPREERPSANPYKKQVRPDRRESLGVFTQTSSGAEGRSYPSGLKNEERIKLEARDKFNTAYNLAKELPPLTDEDYKQVYEELLAYDAAPPSPSEQNLALEAGRSSSTPLLGSASNTARDRISELLERLNRRFPEGDVPMTPVKGRETGEQSLLSKLTKLRQNSPALSLGESGTLSSMLVDPSMVSAGDTQCTSMLDNWSTQAQSDESINTPAKRPHARTRGRIFYALSRLLEPLPGTRADSAQLIIGEQPPDTLKLDIATKQEWAALVLEAANDRSLTDVLTTFELMKRRCVALSEDLLAAAIRLISKDQKLVPILLQYFEQNNIAIPLTAHHEVVVGILQNSPANVPTTKAEAYLRTLEQYNRPALAKTYAAVIKHIFQLRRFTGIRAKAWNLYGHMRLVAHPTPSVEVFDAMIYGCSLDDRVSPERALDLFTEMIELGVQPSYNTYLGLIRTCAKDKDKDSPFYYEALRLLKELLDRNFKPEKDIFNSILEGSRIRGDLFRAKWIVSNMFQLASKSTIPQENPITPDSKIIQNLFLTAATYRPPNISKNAMNLKEISDSQELQEAPGDVTDASQMSSIISSHADQGESVAIQSKSSSPKSGQSSHTEDAEATRSPKSSEILYVRGDSALPLEEDSPQHPLYRPEVPQTTHQLLDDFTQILGAIIEAHDYPSEVLDSYMSSTAKTLSSSNAGFGMVPSFRSDGRRYSAGLDEGTMAALRNIPVNNMLLNSYLTLLTAHGRTNLALSFFENVFPAYNIRPSHQTWETLFETLDSSSRQKDKAIRTKIRAEKASKARELMYQWEEWLKIVLKKSSETPIWFARHVESIYAYLMGGHARAQEIDQGLSILEEFYNRFPPEKIRQAAKANEIKNAGPSYLIQLSSFLYPETMDISINRLNLQDTVNDLTGGKMIRKPLPKSQINNYNLFGIPPLLSYQMIYSLFHRLREEEEDEKATRVLDILNEYRKALIDVLKIREEMEKKEKSADRARDARRGIIELPGRGTPSSRIPRTSRALLESERSAGRQAEAVEAPSLPADASRTL